MYVLLMLYNQPLAYSTRRYRIYQMQVQRTDIQNTSSYPTSTPLASRMACLRAVSTWLARLHSAPCFMPTVRVNLDSAEARASFILRNESQTVHREQHTPCALPNGPAGSPAECTAPETSEFAVIGEDKRPRSVSEGCWQAFCGQASSWIASAP